MGITTVTLVIIVVIIVDLVEWLSCQIIRLIKSEDQMILEIGLEIRELEIQVKIEYKDTQFIRVKLFTRTYQESDTTVGNRSNCFQ